MGWNTCAIFVQDRSPATALQLLSDRCSEFTETETETVDAATATSSSANDVFYATETCGWSQVWDPDGNSVLRLGSPLQETNQVLAVIFGSVSSTYGFMLFQHGELSRQAIYVDGTIVAEEGVPLLVESTIEVPDWGRDEDYVWSVIGAITGLQYDDALLFTQYRLTS